MDEDLLIDDPFDSPEVTDEGFCPECGIGLNNQEIHLGICQNCKAHWKD